MCRGIALPREQEYTHKPIYFCAKKAAGVSPVAMCAGAARDILISQAANQSSPAQRQRHKTVARAV